MAHLRMRKIEIHLPEYLAERLEEKYHKPASERIKEIILRDFDPLQDHPG